MGITWFSSPMPTHLVWHFEIACLGCSLTLAPSLRPFHKASLCFLSCPSCPCCSEPLKNVERRSQRSQMYYYYYYSTYYKPIIRANSLYIICVRQVLLTGKQCLRAADTRMSASGDVLLSFQLFSSAFNTCPCVSNIAQGAKGMIYRIILRTNLALLSQ